MSNKTKSIIVSFTLAGHGAPNKEGKDGKFNWNAWARSVNKDADGNYVPNVQVVDAKNDNCTFAKANYYMGDDGRIVRRVKISGDALRHSIFGSVNNAAIKEDVTTWITFSTSHEGLVRGYLNPDKNGTTVKRKSPLTVTDAELDNGAISQIENKSSSGVRTDTSFFAKEILGKSHFCGEAFIDLSELGVLSCCDTFDRPCVKEEFQQLFEKKLSDNGIGFKKVALRKKSDFQPEICYQFDDATVNELVNILLWKISNIRIGNATEYAQFEGMKVTFVNEDGTREEVAFRDGRLEKDFSVASQYEEADYDEALAAERLTRELIQKTKEKPAKGNKKGKKSEETSETSN